ncbi:MAG: cob(I)yrinic acid a,c-diamide adenosyltransferase [Candidatus Thorarchaeota archaeon]|nr:cob(I)yrinic acid a,c-diamide adenosyltransferase [Candidatus Thorarchaeota archaeon]
MARRIYTRNGDDGTTRLLSGEEIAKDSVHVEAYGTVDELMAVLGVAKVFAQKRLADYIQSIQASLSNIAAELAVDPTTGTDILSKIPRISAEDVEELEHIADELSEELPPLSKFIIPGGTKAASFLHQARTVCRRAERRVVAMRKDYKINQEIIKYLNRLSDLLFVMSRHANLGHEE